MKHKFSKRALSIVLCVALLMSLLPLAAFAAESASDRVVDPSTMDGWKDLFLSDPLTTEHAGRVWTDKSVFTDASAFAGTGITQDDDDSFLVALSAIASNMSVTGLNNVPTDTVMILDLSSSMYNGYDRNPATVQTMLNAVNDSIDKLQKLNPHNRVGVVVYYGGVDRNQSTSANSMVLLPLDRYSGSSTYLKANVSGGRLISVAVNAGLKNSAGNSVHQTTRTVTDVAGTYAQLGILDAMNQLLAADTIIPATADYQPNVTRLPVMVFMSDGEPTAATSQYTQKTDAGMGNNTISIRNPDETDFVTQLTAAYARKMVDDHYVQTEPLFYTLSLGTSVSLAVMDPANNTTGTIDGYWTALLNNGAVDITVHNSPNGWGAPTVRKTYTVSKTTANGATFPASKGQRDYVDEAFSANNVNDLTAAFADIISQISLVSKYVPTLINEDADLSGYISFVDKVGHYMEVTDIKGILIGNSLYSGKELASNFVTGGGSLGTYDDPKPLGDEMVWAVQARLGLNSVDAARTLIGLAYEHGQLSYDAETGEYSNYIGWYANAAGQFLGFWHEGIATMPEPTGNAATDPAFIVKSYGYLGTVDESQGVAESDMMYATVQIRESIQTGEQTVAFAVPAALIPLVSYEVSLGRDGEMTKLNVTGAEHPIRLVYEVALDQAINPYTLMDLVSPEYLAANTDDEGNVSFYSNQYEADNTTGYGKVNTYSYFNPSRQNDRYYYLEDTPLYTDTNGTLYTGSEQPSGMIYRSYIVYEKDGDKLTAKTAYRRVSDASLATAKQREDGSWYIGAGNVHVNLDGYTIKKSENITGTLTDVNQPFVDAHNHSVGDLGYNFIVGSTLGNNGRFTIRPATGIALTKTMAPGSTEPDSAFQFVITNASNSADDGAYEAVTLHTDGSQSVTTVQFSDGKATVELNAGETIYIGGLTAGASYTIKEVETLAYIPNVDAVTVTVADGVMADVEIINADRGSGNLTISKIVKHPLGSDYVIPEDKLFTIHTDLDGVGVANATFPAKHTNGTVTSVTTDADGCFAVVLAHGEQLELFGLPVGVTATVTEPQPGAGFTAAYLDDGKAGDGIVIILENASASVTVENTYIPGGVDDVNVKLGGTKVYTTAAHDWNGMEFEFQLQKWTADGWSTIATATATESKPSFDFNEALSDEKFTAPGTYYYQVLETNGGQTINGTTYDATLHTFGITVTDKDMDGKLEIDKATSFHTGKEFAKDQDGNWQIQITFNNHYEASGCHVVLDVQKALTNLSGSPLVSLSGYRFGLYENGTLVATSELTDGVGEARLILRYELEDEGTHTYILKEIVPENPVKGMIYDDRSYTVVVRVADDGDGTTSATIVSIDGKTEYETPVFTNVYEPKSAELEIDFVDKRLTGRDLEPGEFTFELWGTDNNTKRTGSNDADGNVIFNDVLTFDQVGTWHFYLLETSMDGNGVTTDKIVYNISVTVTDVGGELTADHHVLNVVGDNVIFHNVYEPENTQYTISGNKTLTGRVLLNNEFTFLLSEAADATGTVLEGGVNMETRNFTDGSFVFAPITFSKTGTYFYVVSEKAESGADFGITFDDRRYVVTITVVDDLKGNLEVSDVTYDVIGSEEASGIRFENQYDADPTSAAISGDKTLIGKVLGEGDFAFELYASDENWIVGDKLESVSNSHNGRFVFSTIDYETAGTRYYLVKEVNGGETIDGVVYDRTVYRVTVEITDNLRGHLVSAIHITNGEGIPFEAVHFVNSYQISGEAQVTLEGTKTLTGRELVDGEFTFELYETDETFTVSAEPIKTTENKNGKFQMVLNYTTENVGSTFYYVVKEQNAGQTIDGVTFGNAVYNVTVSVLDDGVGGIRTETVMTDGNTDVSSLDFTNDYTPDDPDNPGTGDGSLALWFAMMAVSCGGVMTLTSRSKNEEEDEE